MFTASIATELLLSGAQVTDHYLNDATATARPFVQGEAAEETCTWYRTGDLVSQHAQCGLRYHDGGDRQLKVRGTRIELQDVEAKLAKMLGGIPTAVLPYRFSAQCCQSLAAFYADPLQPEEVLRRQCTAALAPHIVPERSFRREELPRNANGKIDYMALRALIESLADPHP